MRMRTKTLRAPSPFDSVALIPLFCVFFFCLFLAWEWLSQPAYNAHASNYGHWKYELSGAKSISDVDFASNQLHDESNPTSGDPTKPSENEDPGFKPDECCSCDEAEKEHLLHKWTDEELYSRAIASDSARKLERAGTSCTTWDDDDKSSEEMRIHRVKTCRSYCSEKGSVSLFTGKPKIAFLFMITTSLPFEPLWNKYFEGYKGLYNIYVHADPFNPNLFNSSSPLFINRLIPSSRAYRGSPSLVMASNRLVANAILDDPANSYFALLSGSCAPVRGFDYAYKALTSSGQSFVEQIRNESIMWERYTGRGNASMMEPEIPFDQFRKAAQWFVFTRQHALMILKDVQERKYWGKFDHECKIYFCGTDEHYYPTVLNILDSAHVSGTTVTYVHWPEWVTEHPSEFHRYEVNRDFITDIQRKNDGQYLFARKFDTDTLDLLMSMTDIILT